MSYFAFSVVLSYCVAAVFIPCVVLSLQMYTLLFEALMLPRFGMFEDCDAPPPASSPATQGQKKKKDPTERAFAPRFTGMPPSEEASDVAGGGVGGEGSGDIHRDENFVYLEPVGRERGEEDDGEGESDEEGEEGFDARQNSHRLMVESAASGVSTGAGLAGGGEGKSPGATFLPAARPSGYTPAQLRR